MEEYRHTAAQKRTRLPKLTKTQNDKNPTKNTSGEKERNKNNNDDKIHARTPSVSTPNQRLLEPMKITPRGRMYVLAKTFLF